MQATRSSRGAASSPAAPREPGDLSPGGPARMVRAGLAFRVRQETRELGHRPPCPRAGRAPGPVTGWPDGRPGHPGGNDLRRGGGGGGQPPPPRRRHRRHHGGGRGPVRGRGQDRGRARLHRARRGGERLRRAGPAHHRVDPRLGRQRGAGLPRRLAPPDGSRWRGGPLAHPPRLDRSHRDRARGGERLPRPGSPGRRGGRGDPPGGGRRLVGLGGRRFLRDRLALRRRRPGRRAVGPPPRRRPRPHRRRLHLSSSTRRRPSRAAT